MAHDSKSHALAIKRCFGVRQPHVRYFFNDRPVMHESVKVTKYKSKITVTFTMVDNIIYHTIILRGSSRGAATSKMVCFVIIFKPLTIITNHSILDVGAVLDLPLILSSLLSILKKLPNCFGFLLLTWSRYYHVTYEFQSESTL